MPDWLREQAVPKISTYPLSSSTSGRCFPSLGRLCSWGVYFYTYLSPASVTGQYNLCRWPKCRQQDCVNLHNRAQLGNFLKQILIDIQWQKLLKIQYHHHLKSTNYKITFRKSHSFPATVLKSLLQLLFFLPNFFLLIFVDNFFQWSITLAL